MHMIFSPLNYTCILLTQSFIDQAVKTETFQLFTDLFIPQPHEVDVATGPCTCTIFILIILNPLVKKKIKIMDCKLNFSQIYKK